MSTSQLTLSVSGLSGCHHTIAELTIYIAYVVGFSNKCVPFGEEVEKVVPTQYNLQGYFISDKKENVPCVWTGSYDSIYTYKYWFMSQ